MGMKLKHWIEILGNSIIVIASLMIGLMALMVFDAQGQKFVEPNLFILIGEALAAGAMIGLGAYHFFTDWKQRHPLELAGDLIMILSGLGSGWLFVQLFNGGLLIPYNVGLLWGGLGASVLLMTLAMNRLFDDLARFPKVENFIRRLL